MRSKKKKKHLQEYLIYLFYSLIRRNETYHDNIEKRRLHFQKENVFETRIENEDPNLRNGFLRFAFESSHIHIDFTFDSSRDNNHDIHVDDVI